MVAVLFRAARYPLFFASLNIDALFAALTIKTLEVLSLGTVWLMLKSP
jgi:hypothetical protein